jgi:RimJ/RimL family protein N-acetyltransferase
MFETSRLRLRAGLERDIDGLVSGLNDWTVAQWLVRPPFPYSEVDARQFIQSTRSEDTAAFTGRYVIADRHTDELLGVASLEPVGERAELGYWLRRSAQGHGYMKEAAAALLRQGARSLPGNSTVFAKTDPDNGASQSVLLRLGFKMIAEQPRGAASRRDASTVFLYEAPTRDYL